MEIKKNKIKMMYCKILFVYISTLFYTYCYVNSVELQ